MSSPCTPHETIIQAPCGDLELVVNCPTEQIDIPAPWAVICHPNPAHGGAMSNKVVYMISRALNALGVATVRFNSKVVIFFHCSLVSRNDIRRHIIVT